MSHVAQFVAWEYLHGTPLDAEAMFTPVQVEYYIEVGTKHLAPYTRSTRRGFLRRIGARVTKNAPWAPPPRAFPVKKLAVPYSRDEESVYFQIASQQSTPYKTRIATVHLCLGLGAGLFADEFMAVTGSSLRRIAGVNVLATGGQRARLIPISDRYFGPLQEIAVRHPHEPIIGVEGSNSKNRLNALLSKPEYPARVGRPVTTRLRTTWMQHVLSIPISLSEFAEIAGIRTTKSLTDLIPYIPLREPEQWFPLIGKYLE
jgi:hypothetical protein